MIVNLENLKQPTTRILTAEDRVSLTTQVAAKIVAARITAGDGAIHLADLTKTAREIGLHAEYLEALYFEPKKGW